MQKKAIAAAVCSFVFIVAFFGTIILLKQTLPSNSAMAAETEIHEATQIENEPVTEEKFILREYGGNICVFREEFQEIPAIITEISIDSLTTNDRELLFQGIEVNGKKEVLKLLEDFGS